jgi:hypothetical protein
MDRRRLGMCMVVVGRWVRREEEILWCWESKRKLITT